MARKPSEDKNKELLKKAIKQRKERFRKVHRENLTRRVREGSIDDEEDVQTFVPSRQRDTALDEKDLKGEYRHFSEESREADFAGMVVEVYPRGGLVRKSANEYILCEIAEYMWSKNETPVAAGDEAECVFVDNETYDFTTAAGLDISVTPATWAMGEIDMSDTSNDTSASNGYFNLSNDGGSAIDVNINATNATGAGYQWTLAATADYEQYALQYDLYDGGIEAPEWVSINLTSDTFDQNIEAGGYQEFDLKILYATWASTYDPLTITITFTAVAS